MIHPSSPKAERDSNRRSKGWRLRETLATARTLSREPGVHRLVSDTLEGLLREAIAEQSAALPRLRLSGPFRRRENEN